ncbi:hypothetical protein ZIOFF_019703 [Zingiber officinale]|uniref:Uncharacterized protein n=1 Tax=Zingiber officinale TaxID=94328 RepID=A0A8J5HI93_ZINOF|nr:hypothetical protein ZIOFF_019703 [Zingiber officinale]
MAALAFSFWFLCEMAVLANSIILLISFVAGHVSRTRAKGATSEEKSSFEFRNHESSSSAEKEEGRLAFKFQYQVPDQHGESNAEGLMPVVVVEEVNSASKACVRKYNFSCEKDLCAFVEEPKVYETDLFNEVVRDNVVAAVSEEFSGFDSECDSISVSDGYSVHDLVVDSDGFLSERELEVDDELKSSKECQEMNLKFTDSSSDDDDDDDDEVTTMNKKYSARKETDDASKSSTGTSSSSSSLLDLEMDANLQKSYLDEQTHELEKAQVKGSVNEDRHELESLWEHQELIEQLRMELRKLKDIGLPTILEEPESPITVEDLKPLMMDESFMHEDSMDEMQKFHWSYRERMRKLDILNYQKMYAIGFLQLKDDPLQSVGSRRTLGLAFQSIFAQSSWSVRRKSNVNPSERLIKELQTDLEVVYVGQTCLSWEFLRWQYEKAREMPQLSDPFGNHFYNQAAREFQQFQVNIQRFIENEAFQGPRLRNFIQNRCVLHNLLQVPLLKGNLNCTDSTTFRNIDRLMGAILFVSEDCLKDKMLGDGQGMSGEKMEEIMEESIRIFWEFVKADKDETPGILRGFMGTHVELQDPSDFYLVEDIQFDLHKKEKKLKDILRTGNCLVKKFKKPKEDRSNEDVFFSQVDLKLVGRVLRMPRITTEQLLWCHKKLSKIKFVERKVFREPCNFLEFPC